MGSKVRVEGMRLGGWGLGLWAEMVEVTKDKYFVTVLK